MPHTPIAPKQPERDRDGESQLPLAVADLATGESFFGGGADAFFGGAADAFFGAVADAFFGEVADAFFEDVVLACFSEVPATGFTVAPAAFCNGAADARFGAIPPARFTLPAAGARSLVMRSVFRPSTEFCARSFQRLISAVDTA